MILHFLPLFLAGFRSIKLLSYFYLFIYFFFGNDYFLVQYFYVCILLFIHSFCTFYWVKYLFLVSENQLTSVIFHTDNESVSPASIGISL